VSKVMQVSEKLLGKKNVKKRLQLVGNLRLDYVFTAFICAFVMNFVLFFI